MKPCITTIIPTYNRAHLLPHAIKTVLQQNFDGVYKVLVCDNGSEDATPDLMQLWSRDDPRIEYIRHTTNLGLISNYRFGLNRVTTPFVSFLSDDDKLLPNFYTQSLELFDRYPRAAFVATSTVIADDQGTFIRAPLEEWGHEGLYEPEEGVCAMLGKYPVPTTILFRRDAIDSAWIDPLNPTYWDCGFLLHTAGRYPFAISKIRTGSFLQHPGSYSYHFDSRRIVLGYERIRYIVTQEIRLPPHARVAAERKLDRLHTADLKACVRSHVFSKTLPEALIALQYLQGHDPRRARYYTWLLKMCAAAPYSLYGLRALRKCKHIAQSFVRSIRGVISSRVKSSAHSSAC